MADGPSTKAAVGDPLLSCPACRSTSCTSPPHRTSTVRCAAEATVCQHGTPRITGGSHAVFKMPWPGDPRVNIQNDNGKTKPYQVRPVLEAIDKKEAP